MSTAAHDNNTSDYSQYLGIIYITVGLGLFIGQDIVIKLFSDTFSVLQLLVIRSSFAPLIVLFLCWNSGRLHLLKPKASKLVLLRATCVFFSYTSYYIALASLPLAVAVAIFYFAPLIVVALSRPLLGEQVSIAQWLAVICGFGGTLLMVNPDGDSLEAPALMVVASAFFYALSAIVARKITEPVDGWNLSFYTNLAPIPFFIIIYMAANYFQAALPTTPEWNFLTLPWIWPNAEQAWWLLLLAIIGAVGHNLIGQAYRVSPVKYVAPFEYSALVWAVISGFLIWGELPELYSWIGLLIIVGSGAVAALSAGRENRRLLKYANRGSSNKMAGPKKLHKSMQW